MKNVQAVKGLYCPLWLCFRCCILSVGGSLRLHAGGSTRYLIQAAGCKSRFVPAPMLSKCCCICFKSLYISLLCSQLHKYKLIVIYLSSENVKGLKDCFQACFSSKSYVSRLFGGLFLPPTAPNCEELQAVKGLYCLLSF